MTFERPELFLLGPACALLLVAFLALQWRRLRRLGRAYGAVPSLRLVPRGLQRFPAARTFCLVAAAFASAAAAAGLRSEAPATPESPRLLDVALLVDASRSMGTDDVEPSRILRARSVVTRISEALPQARIVLVLFADWPYTLVPPTDDPAVVRYFAHSLSAELVLDRDQGTSFSTALTHAREALDARSRPGARREIVLLSDGGAHEAREMIAGAVTAASQGDVHISTGGLGTRAGATLSAGTGPLVDDGGRPVRSALDDEILRMIAQAGGGEYHDVGSDAGLLGLLTYLGATSEGGTPSGDDEPDPTLLLLLAAVSLLLVEGGLDVGWSPLRRSRPRWDA